MAGENKIHVNKKTGKSGICDAKIKCPLGEDAPHFNTQKEADGYISAMEAEQNETFPNVSKKQRSKAEARKQRKGQHNVVAGRALTRTLPETITPETPLNDMIHLAEYKGEQVNLNIQEVDGSIHLSRGGDDEEEVLHMRTLAHDQGMTTLRYNAEETLYDGSRERATLLGDNGEVMEVQLKPGAGSGGVIMEVESFIPAPQRPKAKQAQIDELRGQVEYLELSRDALWRRTMENIDEADRLAGEGKYEELEEFYTNVTDPTVRERDAVESDLEAAAGRLRGMLGRS